MPTPPNDVLAFPHALERFQQVCYEDEQPVAIWVENVSTVPVHIRKVSLRLEADTGVDQQDPRLITTVGTVRYLEPGAKHFVMIPVAPPLCARPESNVPRVMAEYHVLDGAGRIDWTREYESQCLIVNPAPQACDRPVFVSFADPEDLALAECAATHLTRAGFAPYLARRDPWPGCEYWRDKLEPAIQNAEAILVIWTAITEARPATVMREMAHARTVGTSLGLIREQSVELPPSYPRDVYEYAVFQRDTFAGTCRDVIATAAIRWRATAPMFSGSAVPLDWG
jgi:hypothetical protein